jgi:hypothetical protein
MVPLSAFTSRIAPLVPNCSDMLIEQSVLDTCIHFCQNSLVVKRMLDSFLTTVGQREYPLTVTLPEQVVAVVMRVWCDNTEMGALDEDAINTTGGFVTTVPGFVTQLSTPRYFNETDPGTLSFYPVPDKAYTINMRVALNPTRTALTVADQLFNDWAEGIVSGALSRLMMQPGEYFNPSLAKVQEKQYVMWLNQAMVEARKGSTRAQSRVSPVHI